ncbi:MAG TPA: glutaminase, partial [Gemmatimonadaceae bacterium]|nr:glutaminase [Gemmatimonadaceae bacterium]
MRSFAHKTERVVRRFVIGATLVAASARLTVAQTPAEYQRAVNAAYDKYKNLHEGKNADYIPALAKVNPDLFGIALVTPDGKAYTAGDVGSEVSIQSVSKVFIMAHVFQQTGEKTVEDNIGVDATGQAFNSIVAIEQYKGKEMNPLVNAGAITTTSMIAGNSEDVIWTTIINTLDDFAGRQLKVDNEVYKSEAATNQRNQAIA